MFLHVSVILYTGGVGVSGEPPRDQADTPPDQADPPGRENTPRPPDQADPPGPRRTPQQGEPPPDQADPPPGRRLQHTVNERPVRILLECILVFNAHSQVATPEIVIRNSFRNIPLSIFKFDATEIFYLTSNYRQTWRPY